ncbi:phosphofructokinase-domain-containing protein [Syncephalis pseudoplumigaleata]|uniref:ATP-dependent 6-phosphofructokinase n=1 Tax=Syncephalis pseudoplumigaleata TaxID=1712513 RepID=A0A4P9Z6N4_9FUNG|nr:phosphofructokinase-domain-containing protein [Syncephalis pseudoplumigaleata]|eukprot:RKP27832.1 phosphofructokinase-domain-containing protein [Syncephalis pseudoplumigaleata]
MNAAVRAIVRVAISEGCEPYGIIDGYQGLVEGGDNIRPFAWNDVRGYLNIGGTSIGTARCKEFRERQGRLDAAYNLVERGIDSLVVIGGDGSLTGADILRDEWPGLIEELHKAGRITSEHLERHRHLTIVGLVGSIDNDMAGTDITIGAISCLHRICEAVDSIASTATSHSRAFVVEVMGRHCGWLALMAGIAIGADFLFVPERPPPKDWEDVICKTLVENRRMGKRKLIVIVAEGAIDSDLNPIKPDHIKDVLTTKAGLDTRVTTLGHIQRGGVPAAFDRATMQGVEAVRAVLHSTPNTPSPMIGINANKITSRPLMEAVKQTHQVAEAIEKKDFEQAMNLRDSEFATSHAAYEAITLSSSLPQTQSDEGLRIGIMHVGAPAAGLSAATRAAVRFSIKQGHRPFAIYNGFRGLMRGEVKEFGWMDVDGWQVRGGSELGTNRFQPDDDFGLVAYQMQRFNLQALMIIGGFEAYTALHALQQQRPHYPAFCIPMIHLPATLSNNVPGTDYSLGCDTAMNVIVESCDRIKQSATASRRRVFVVEVQGGECGYLATMAGLAAGATCVYTPEDGISLARIQSDVQHLIRLYSLRGNKGRQGTIVLRTEAASSTYTTNVLADIFKEEAHNLFDARTAILGHLQQGGTPSPLDRIRATNLAVRCIDWLARMAREETPAHSPYAVYTTSEASAAVVGTRSSHVVCTPITQLWATDTDCAHRRAIHQWWRPVNKLVRVFAKYGIVEAHEEKAGASCLSTAQAVEDVAEDLFVEEHDPSEIRESELENRGWSR